MTENEKIIAYHDAKDEVANVASGITSERRKPADLVAAIKEWFAAAQRFSYPYHFHCQRCDVDPGVPCVDMRDGKDPELAISRVHQCRLHLENDLSKLAERRA